MTKYRVIENIDEGNVLGEVCAQNLDEAYQKIKCKFGIKLMKLQSSMYTFEIIDEDCSE